MVIHIFDREQAELFGQLCQALDGVELVHGQLVGALVQGRSLVLPAGAGVAFDHTPAFHLEDLLGEGLVVRPIRTLGHTTEHVSYLVMVGGRPVAVFSGGSPLVGSAGRPDLLGVRRASSRPPEM